jgi:hypothetical protein
MTRAQIFEKCDRSSTQQQREIKFQITVVMVKQGLANYFYTHTICLLHSLHYSFFLWKLHTYRTGFVKYLAQTTNNKEQRNQTKNGETLDK